MEDLEGPRWRVAIVWFRRDLRLSDHPALNDAIGAARHVVPLFVADDRLLGGPDRHQAPLRTSFLLGSLLELDEALRARGSGLLVRAGRPEDVVTAVARELGADAVYATRDVTPFAYRRDRAVSEALAREGRSLHLRPGVVLVEPETALTAAGAPYAVFTPFWRTLQRLPRRELIEPPPVIATPTEAITGSRVLLESLVEASPAVASAPRPGESAAHERLRRWSEIGVRAYDEGRHGLSGSATSRLGQDLHLGLLSPRQVESAVSEVGTDATAFVRQLAWREFYHHELFHQRAHPERATDGRFASIFRSEADDPVAVDAWRQGQTGIPVVDAGMRQLQAEGWMSNRARLVVASFLTRHLLMDHRIGERHFMRHLIDGDVANNRGGWRWTAGVGADPQPWFRIFNPVLQGQRFDADGAWVRRWIPELANVPTRYVHAPWQMPPQTAADAGVEIGRGLPRADHRLAGRT